MCIGVHQSQSMPISAKSQWPFSQHSLDGGESVHQHNPKWEREGRILAIGLAEVASELDGDGAAERGAEEHNASRVHARLAHEPSPSCMRIAHQASFVDLDLIRIAIATVVVAQDVGP